MIREESRIKERQKPEAELSLEGRRRLGLLTFRTPQSGAWRAVSGRARGCCLPPTPSTPHPPSQSLSPSQSARAVLC